MKLDLIEWETEKARFWKVRRFPKGVDPLEVMRYMHSHYNAYPVRLGCRVPRVYTRPQL